MSSETTRTLSEADSKQLLAEYGLPILAEYTVATVGEAVVASVKTGLPCVLKLCGDTIAHKTERNLVRLGLASNSDVERAAEELLGQATTADGAVALLVAPMVRAAREFIVGADRSDEFGPVVMIGVGGIFAEALEDVAFRLLPVATSDIEQMIDDLATQSMLDEFRGEPAVDRAQLIAVVKAVGDAMVARDDIASIDINPVLIADGKAVAVDALVALV